MQDVTIPGWFIMVGSFIYSIASGLFIFFLRGWNSKFREIEKDFKEVISSVKATEEKLKDSLIEISNRTLANEKDIQNQKNICEIRHRDKG